MNEAGAETLTVLYEPGGRILALTRQQAEPPLTEGPPVLRSGPDPLDGQRTVVIDVDPAWSARPLLELAQHFVVAHADGERPCLRERDRRGV